MIALRIGELPRFELQLTDCATAVVRLREQVGSRPSARALYQGYPFDRLRRRLGLDASALPLAKILEGGTWAAGRRLARDRRADASPPIKIISDGTVF